MHSETRKTMGSWLLRFCVVGIYVVIPAVWLRVAYQQSQDAVGAHIAQRQQQAFDEAKQGAAAVMVMDSGLLPVLANDADCCRHVTRLDFVEAAISPTDAASIQQLTNLTAIAFYGSSGVKDVLLAARSLPVTELHFEMTDLKNDDYLILKEFDHLNRVHFEHVMDDDCVNLLKTELPTVDVEALWLRSQQE